MDRLAEATLTDGRKIQYVITDNPPRGGMKYTYFAPDRSYVVQFFLRRDEARDPDVRRRLEAIIGKYNPTRSEEDGGAQGSSRTMAEYFSKKFCWPSAIVQSPEFGVVCPAYPKNFLFQAGSSGVLELAGKDKRSNWFTTRNRRFLRLEELGNFRSMLQISTSLARSVRRMHQAGLAHSDLSCNNVLIDPQSGSCVVIDIDSLVVPGIFPPKVVGTRGYIAPEVLETMQLPSRDAGRRQPSTYTDLHALAVLIYEYLLLRHPLIGPKLHAPDESELDDFLTLGPKALFIEDPDDHSNRPDDLEVTIKDLGPALEELFLRAFVDGLHNPAERPSAMEWEKALVKTEDLLHRCEDPECAAQWFILHDPKRPVCPFCGGPVRRSDIVRLHQKVPLRGRAGQWTNAGVVNLYDNMPLYPWHVLANTFPDEKTEGGVVACACKSQGQWMLVNCGLRGMSIPGGGIVPVGRAVPLRDGTVFRACGGEKGFLIEVSCGG